MIFVTFVKKQNKKNTNFRIKSFNLIFNFFCRTKLFTFKKFYQVCPTFFWAWEVFYYQFLLNLFIFIFLKYSNLILVLWLRNIEILKKLEKRIWIFDVLYWNIILWKNKKKKKQKKKNTYTHTLRKVIIF